MVRVREGGEEVGMVEEEEEEEKVEEEEQKGRGERKQKLHHPELTINFPKN